MKIITLNIAHRDDLGQDYETRIRRIAGVLDSERADIVCLQAVAFTKTESQADEINRLMKNPYKFIKSELSRRCKIADVAPDRRSAGMRELYAKDPEAFFTDGQAVMSNWPIERAETIVLTKVAPGFDGRLDRHPRLAQNVDFTNGIKISNVHLAANSNSYQQLDELIRKNDDDRFIVGDLNMTRKLMQNHRNIWHEKFKDSLDFLDYVSFPSDGVAYDHLLLPKPYHFTEIKTIDNLSDHSAVIFEVERKAKSS